MYFSRTFRNYFVPASLLLLACPSLLLAIPQLDTHVGQGVSDPGFYHDQTSNSATSLSDNLTGGHHTASVSVSYGSASVDSAAGVPSGDYFEANYSVGGKWKDTLTINNPALTGQAGVARFTVHLNGTLAETSTGGAAGYSQYGLYLESSLSAALRSSNVLQGTVLNGFGLTNIAPGRVGTSLSLLDGTASTAETLQAAFVAPPVTINLASDAVEFAGTGNDLVVVQMSYSPTLAQALFGSEAVLRLAWLNPATGLWLNAIFGNSGGAPNFVARAYNAATDFHLGNFGVDTINHVVWAVVNHNSEFGVSAVADPLAVTTAVSRKTHGLAGTFDINLPFTGALGVECRSGGAGGNHTLVITFSNDVVSGSASLTEGTGTISGSPVFAANTMTVNLIGVSDFQRITVKLSGVTDSHSAVLPETNVSANMLLGDTNNSSAVSNADVSQTKAQAGNLTVAGNFRTDTNLSGSISNADISQVKANSGHTLPPILRPLARSAGVR